MFNKQGKLLQEYHVSKISIIGQATDYKAVHQMNSTTSLLPSRSARNGRNFTNDSLTARSAATMTTLPSRSARNFTKDSLTARSAAPQKVIWSKVRTHTHTYTEQGGKRQQHSMPLLGVLGLSLPWLLRCLIKARVAVKLPHVGDDGSVSGCCNAREYAGDYGRFVDKHKRFGNNLA